MQRPSDALPQHSILFSSAADLEAPLTIDHKCFLVGGGEDGAGGPHVGPYGGRPRGMVVHCLRRCVGNAKPKSFSCAKAILAMSASPHDGFDQFVNRSSHSPLRGGTAFLASLGLRQDEFSSLANDDIVKDCNDGEAAEPPENMTVDENTNEAGVVPRRRKTVLILMSDTGGGHRASAEAIKATFQLEFGDEYEVVITDLWKEYTPWPFNQLPRSYGFLVRHSTLWKATYHVTAPRIVHRTHFAVTSTFIARKVMQGLLKHKPDVIVSVHPLMQHIPLRILKARGLLKKIPFTTVITDLSTCHPTWFHRLVTRCFCPTKEVAEKALKAGLKTTQIRVYGLPIRPSFCKDIPPKVELRRALGMNEELPAVLLMGGGEGMGPVESTAKALGESLFCQQSGEAIGQLVVICGRNMKLVKNLQSFNWSIPVQIRGFEKNIEEWMGACDCLITKAGPGTIAEAMIRGLPLILSDYIAGQEVGNVPFVVDNGAGKFLKEPKKIAQTVADWFGPQREELHIMSRNALKLARPDAVFKIVHDLDRLARRKVFLEENRTLVAT